MLLHAAVRESVSHFYDGETENTEELGLFKSLKPLRLETQPTPPSSPWSKDLSYDSLWQVRDTESSITPKPIPDKPNDMIKDDILHFILI